MFAWLTSVLLLLGIWRSLSRWKTIRRQVEILLGLFLAQIFVGYLQYFSGVPSQLVAIHIAMSMAVTIAATDVGWSSWRRSTVSVQPHASVDL